MNLPLTPREIVSELDRFIVGQNKAKRAVAIALRNRWRRLQLSDELREEVTPKNILMIGPTGVGKTEIARRLAKLAKAPFIKVEASKFTEVGYVGRDVESIIRDLVETAVQMVRAEHAEQVKVKAQEVAEERILDALLPKPRSAMLGAEEKEEDPTRRKLRWQLRTGELNERTIEIELPEAQPAGGIPIGIMGQGGMEDIGRQFQEMMGQMMAAGRGRPGHREKVTVLQALRRLEEVEAQRLVDENAVREQALRRAQEEGIVFIDEIDKVCRGSEGGRSGADVSREGVQRDLLPIVEGSTVSTRYGVVCTDHVLFVASGAFHVAKPSDLIPELQGRFPIRVEMDSLTATDFVRILTEPKNALVTQYAALLGTEGVGLSWDDEAIAELARLAESVNRRVENIGARRLHTLMEQLLEEVAFTAQDRSGETIVFTEAMVRERLGALAGDDNLSRYIL
ncbi:MAG: HslU--HslV peptidase ATPase subunit [Alphaproteobacteria bacterium CG_4_10_14_0_2_um_filter_63_37]|nr:MAG: HslU--HslV peptidase ATPase subunit [Proteobacteria bacterium CG1_02_64_396]PJA24835.1 MAG: HslU--HslV peptidase ATPase subunit [Alphaproteobacteria bacterium CG_4_10_14_0_2_um_filter_63_37]